MTTKLIVVFPKYCTIQLKHHYWEDLPFTVNFSIFSLMLKLLQMNFNSSWYNISVPQHYLSFPCFEFQMK